MADRKNMAGVFTKLNVFLNTHDDVGCGDDPMRLKKQLQQYRDLLVELHLVLQASEDVNNSMQQRINGLKAQNKDLSQKLLEIKMETSDTSLDPTKERAECFLENKMVQVNCNTEETATRMDQDSKATPSTERLLDAEGNTSASYKSPPIMKNMMNKHRRQYDSIKNAISVLKAKIIHKDENIKNRILNSRPSADEVWLQHEERKKELVKVARKLKKLTNKHMALIRENIHLKAQLVKDEGDDMRSSLGLYSSRSESLQVINHTSQKLTRKKSI